MSTFETAIFSGQTAIFSGQTAIFRDRFFFAKLWDLLIFIVPHCFQDIVAWAIQPCLPGLCESTRRKGAIHAANKDGKMEADSFHLPLSGNNAVGRINQFLASFRHHLPVAILIPVRVYELFGHFGHEWVWRQDPLY